MADDDAPMRRLTSRTVHRTPWLCVREDAVRLADGRDTTYTVIECGHCVGVLPFVDARTVLLVRQYRYIAGRTTWEMPTGGVRTGEAIEDAAQRELAEEAGCRARRLRHVCTYHTSKSSIDETAHLHIGTDLEPARADQDADEEVAAEPMPFAEALAKVLSGEITDSMTIIAVLHAARDPTR